VVTLVHVAGVRLGHNQENALVPARVPPTVAPEPAELLAGEVRVSAIAASAATATTAAATHLRVSPLDIPIAVTRATVVVSVLVAAVVLWDPGRFATGG
jgi:hypothetical protein